MLKKYIIIGTIIGVLFLGGIYMYISKKQEAIVEENIKQDFYLETQAIGTFTNEYILTKTAKIDSDTEVSLNSESYGKLLQLNVREGQKISKGELLATLEDSFGAIGIAYKQAKTNLDQAKNNYASNKISLDKAVFDAEINLEKLQLNYTTLEKNVAENLKQAKDSLENSTLTDLTSKSNLDLQRLDENIVKLEFDLQRTKNSNQENLKTFLSSIQKELDNLKNLTADTTDFGDKLFYISGKYRKDKSVDRYFGAKDINQKNNTRIILQDLINFKNTELQDIKITNLSELNTYSKLIKKGYSLNTNFLQEIEKTVKNSLPSIGDLSVAQLDGYAQVINGYQSQIQGLNSSFVGLKNQITTFLNTYKQAEESIAKQIKITKRDREILKKSLESGELSAEVAYNKTVISSDDSLGNIKISLKNAKNLLQTAKKNRDVTLRSLSNNIKKAEISLQQAAIQYEKLSIHSPINGIVSSVNAEVGQTYPSGTLLIKIISISENELDIYLTAEELEKIQIGQEVFIDYRGKKFVGKVFSKSNLADANLNYKITISIPEKISLIGGIADVKFHLKSKKKLIPINAIEVLPGEKKMGKIQTFSDATIKQETIELGKTFGDKIEFITDIDSDTKVILNDISNFDNEKFNLIEK